MAKLPRGGAGVVRGQAPRKMGTFLGPAPADASGGQRNGLGQLSAQNLGRAKPWDLLFFLRGFRPLPRQLGRPAPSPEGEPFSRACAVLQTWPWEGRPDATLGHLSGSEISAQPRCGSSVWPPGGRVIVPVPVPVLFGVWDSLFTSLETKVLTPFVVTDGCGPGGHLVMGVGCAEPASCLATASALPPSGPLDLALTPALSP